MPRCVWCRFGRGNAHRFQSNLSTPASIGCAVVIWIVATAWAQLPIIELNHIYPPGGQQGQTLEAKVTGANQDDADRLLFSHPGITATRKMAAPDAFRKEPQPVEGEFVVSITPDVPPGLYDVRVVGRFGASNPRRFQVGSGPELLDDGTNKSPEKARELKPGMVVNGTVEASNFEHFAFDMTKGERLVIECIAQRIDSRLDATIRVFDEQGRELARSRDAVGRDPVIDFAAPAAGRYRAVLYDYLYRGGADYFYRFSIHKRPHIDFVYPPSGPAGAAAQFTVYGRHLPGGKPVGNLQHDGMPLEQLDVTISLPNDPTQARQGKPATFVALNNAMLRWVPYRLQDSNAVPVYVARAPLVREAEPNDPAKPQQVTIPCEFTGQFFPAGDRDCLEFAAKAGDVLLIEMLSHQLGLNTDPYLLVQKVTKNDKGVETVTDVAAVDDPADRNTRIGTDFDLSTDDPSYRLQVKEDARYRLTVHDQFGSSRSHPRSVYRLVIRHEQPDFALLAVPKSLAAMKNNNTVLVVSPLVRRGGATQIEVLVDRRGDWDDAIELSVEGLPPGITATPAEAGPTAKSVYLVVTAADNAAAWAGPIRIVGKAKVGGQEIVREASYGTAVWGTTNRAQAVPEFRLARALTLAVSDKETAPAFVQVGDGQLLETAIGGKLEIPVKTVRRNGNKETMKLVALGLPAEIKPKDLSLAGDATNGKLELELSNPNTKPGLYTFPLWADVKVKYARNEEAVAKAEAWVKQVDEIVKQADAELKMAADAAGKAMQAATEAAAKRKQADQEKTAAAQASQAAADAVKQANDKLEAAKKASQANAGDAGLKDAVQAAERAAQDAAANAAKAAEKLAQAEKALAKAKADDDAAKASAAKAQDVQKAANDKAQQAKGMKTKADADLKTVKTANQAKDVQVPIVSTPVRLRVVESPVEVTATNVTGKQGGSVQLPISVKRKYGFADTVEISFTAPAGTTGVTSKPLVIAKDKNDGQLELAIAANATPGQHTAKLRVRTKFGAVTKDVQHEVRVTVNKEDK